MSRPTFQINPRILKSLRTANGLTQAQLAERIYSKLGTTPSEKTRITTYQRIERTGKTSLKMATAIANALSTTVEIMQGKDTPEDPVSLRSRIAQHIREQRSSGNNSALAQTLNCRLQSSPLSDSWNEDTCLQEFVEEISAQIELAMIGQNSTEIKRLAVLIGWDEAKVRNAAGIHGHWLLLASSGGSVETEVVIGVLEVLRRIQNAAVEWPNRPESDTQITLNRSLPWYHVDIPHPRFEALRCKFSFVRCKPSETGLKWINPNRTDQLQIEEPLRQWAYSSANFCTDFDGKTSPGNLKQLRFRVQELAGGTVTRVAYSAGDLSNLSDETIQRFRATEGSGHHVCLERLASGLARSLAPLLSQFPSTCWDFIPGTRHIAIILELPYKLMQASNTPNFGMGRRYEIDLVEEISTGGYQKVPWREDSVKHVCKALSEHVFADGLDAAEVAPLQFANLADCASQI